MPEEAELSGHYEKFEAVPKEDPSGFKMDPFRGKTIKSLKPSRETDRLLDVGCGKGEMVYCLMNEGYDAVGVEPYFKPEYENEELNRRIISKTIFDAGFEDGRFSLITMWSVMEHIIDPEPLLKEVARLLKPGGRLIISVPNLNTWQHRLLKNCWLGFGPPGHVFVYSETGLARIMEERGFRLVRSVPDRVNDSWILKNSIYIHLFYNRKMEGDPWRLSKNFSKARRSLIGIFAFAFVRAEGLLNKKATANLVFEKK